MADFKYKGLDFPFKESQTGTLIALTTTERERIKANLIFLITTQRKQRWMRPSFGLNIQQYFFEPLTNELAQSIKGEIIEAVTKSLPSVKIESINILEDEKDKRFFGIDISFKIISGLTSTTETATILF